tara:strand:- start:451 stop:2190 length:1740 start_codon:yes stop_codon:yes gene_type:complete
MTSRIVKISGPTVHASGLSSCFMHEVVKLGPKKLLGEIIMIEGPLAVIQVYEDTMGLKIGEGLEQTGELLSVELGPGLIGSIFDGIQRPLPELADRWGSFIQRGVQVYSLNRKKKWHFIPSVKKGDKVTSGMVLGTVQETKKIAIKILVPKNIEGVVQDISEGEFTITEPVVKLDNGKSLPLMQRCNIRQPRSAAGRLPVDTPMLTGQRILDTLFPVGEGGSAVIPGGFGTGKTVLEHTIAKYADADIIIYIGCGERGNEMADILHHFPLLKDPYTGRSLMERTILIANTSNMPVAAREASIYTGMTIAEYFRDMGFRVAIMADSTSRWAEALREISSRLEEMPGEEGYPTYLASRLGAFYERAGRVRCLGRPDEIGTITIIGAVSPPGGDFSEPTTQASMRMASTFWALDYDLAHQRHFPAINWTGSYSLIYPDLIKWYEENVDPNWPNMVSEVHAILQREEKLIEAVKIIGLDAMGDRERVELEGSRLIREGYLRQSSFHPTDAFCSFHRQEKMLSLFLYYYKTITNATKKGGSLDKILQAPMKESLLRTKELDEEKLDTEIERLRTEIKDYYTVTL